jgi:hypothetical protein
MTSRALVRSTRDDWVARGKTPAEIAADIQLTRERMNADIHALGEKLSPRRITRRAVKIVKWPAAGIALALAWLFIRHRRR